MAGFLRAGRLRDIDTQPVLSMLDSLARQQTTNTTKRTAEEVYWSYVAIAGEEACAYAVLNYLDESMVVEILLEHIDAEDLDECLHDNVS